MSIIEFLKRKKQELLTAANRDYEFDADFNDHPINDNGIYRLHYMNFHRIGEYAGRADNNIGIMDFPFQPFTLPENMPRQDAFKVLSYLSDYLERELEIEPCSCQSVKTLDEMLNVKRLGFDRPNYVRKPFEGVELFTITGRLALFKKMPEYKKYFEWYTEGVTREEVEEIYRTAGHDFEDIILESKSPEDKHKSRKK